MTDELFVTECMKSSISGMQKNVTSSRMLAWRKDLFLPGEQDPPVIFARISRSYQMLRTRNSILRFLALLAAELLGTTGMDSP